MRKFMVVSGFLGSGKTTIMMALTNWLGNAGTKAVMITNDLGHKGLADHCYARAAGTPSEEISGECICFVTEDLVSKLRLMYDDGAEIVMSDIPGFGVGALEHVYYKLRDEYPDECSLAPFTVITEGAVLKRLMEGPGDHDLNCLMRSQLREADLIVLNKNDLYTEGEREAYLHCLAELCQNIPVITVSANTGEGIPELAEYICTHDAELREPDFGVTQEAFDEAFSLLSEYNCQYYTEVCCETFDVNDYLTELAKEIRAGILAEDCDIPHLKLFSQCEDGDYCRVDLTGAGQEPSLTHRMEERQTELPVVLNTTAAASSVMLAEIIDEAIKDVSGRYNLSVVMYFEECFGLND